MGVTRVKVEEVEEKKEEKVKEKIKVLKPKKAKAIVRVAGTDLEGEKQAWIALKKIKGIGFTMSRAICKAAGIDPKIKLKDLDEKQIEKIEEVIKDPGKFGIPPFLFNRRKDLETGKDLHLTSSELEIAKKLDIQRMIDLKTYKGIRHMLGLPVRGQRTRSSFRKGRTVGVVRRKEAAKTEKK
ncbi:MAG: 30S ribosomal protein S13 [Candidatus Aenigmatarchaeota archaeon]